ncbi:hypothetical protein [Neisseria sp. Ec49-e6-T10]|uniref:hypothetical protein n=1 Tax=Neisseria sp. Ec49-e6-T10 TaxID=3140744 RepID=UPI003EB744EC
MGIQSIIYALLLEYLVNQKIKNNIITVATSTILGIASGMSLIFLDEDAPMPIVGTTVGLIVGIIIRFMYLRAQKTQIDR